MTLDNLTPAERKELDTLVGRIADAIDRALIVEVDDPVVRRLVVAEVAERWGV